MDWHTIRSKVLKGEEIEITPTETAGLLLDLYDMFEDLEERVKKLEASKNAD